MVEQRDHNPFVGGSIPSSATNCYHSSAVEHFIGNEEVGGSIPLDSTITNHMLIQSIIGYVAAFCTTISFLPQVILIIKTSSTSAISLPMYLIYIVGVLLWLIYGILISDNVIIIANFFTLCLAGIVLFFKLRNDFFCTKK